MEHFEDALEQVELSLELQQLGLDDSEQDQTEINLEVMSGVNSSEVASEQTPDNKSIHLAHQEAEDDFF